MLSRLKQFAPLFLLLATVASATPVKLEVGTGTGSNKEALAYNPATLKVKAGSKVTLSFTNNSSSKGIVHNFVLVKPGKGQAVVDASIGAGPDKGWIADNGDILAKTKLVAAGETETLEFTAPAEPGDYPYVCTFPGHSAMRGVLKVTK